MQATERMRVVRMLEKMVIHQEYSKRLGLQDASAWKRRE